MKNGTLLFATAMVSRLKSALVLQNPKAPILAPYFTSLPLIWVHKTIPQVVFIHSHKVLYIHWMLHI